MPILSLMSILYNFLTSNTLTTKLQQVCVCVCVLVDCLSYEEIY